MGGGGHPGAGSAMLKSVNPATLKEWILELLNGNRESSIANGNRRPVILFKYYIHKLSEKVTVFMVAAFSAAPLKS